MNQTFRCKLSDQDVIKVPGILAPVRGLALVRTACDCGDPLYGVLHIRSGTGLMLHHSPEVFGEKFWDRLSVVNWDRPAPEIEKDPLIYEAFARASVLAPGHFVGNPMTETRDLPAEVD